MKKALKTVALLSFTIGTTTFGYSLPEEVEAPIEKIFIPQGFDDNDNVEIVLKGTFPNACYRVGRTEAEVNKETQEINVKAYSYSYKDALCPLVMTNFIQTIKVGLLEAGDYTVKMQSAKTMDKEFQVSERKTESADEFLYATVENAYLNVDIETTKQTLVLKGHHPLWLIGCQVITDVRTYRDENNVLVVLPISEIFQGEVCDTQTEDRSFTQEVGLEQPFTEEGIIHVRTLNGNSVNTYVGSAM